MIKAFRGVAKQAVSREELFGVIQHSLPNRCRHRHISYMGVSSSNRSSEASRCASMTCREGGQYNFESRYCKP